VNGKDGKVQGLNTKVQRLAFLSIVFAFVIMAVKFWAWWLTGSVALYSDALESIVNVIASFAAWLAIRYSQRPPDATHPFGHHKAEYLSAVLEGVLIAIAALLIVHEAAQAIITPGPIEAAWAGITINLLAALANGLWAVMLLRIARQAKSPALEADAHHIFSDVVTSVGVAIGLAGAVVTGYHILDPLLALIVAVNILWQGWKIISSSINALLDHALPDEQQDLIRRVITENSAGAIEFHDLKTREAGAVRFAEMHLVVSSGMSVARSHQICDRIETALRKAMPDIKVIIHVEPENKRKFPAATHSDPVPR
jgi:cation diffusion facilitator family transporter